MKLRYYSMAAALVAAALVAYAFAYPSLPERIPIHWNVHGKVDAYGSAGELLAIGPGLMALLAVLFVALPWLSPRRFAVDTFEKTYLVIMLIAVALPGCLFGLVLWSALTGSADAVPKALLAGLCFFTLLIGNVLGKVRRNFFIGIRTPWTLASERTWYATHRFAAKSIVLASLFGSLLALAGVPLWFVIALLLTGFLAPVIYSLVYFKRLERDGEADAAT